jgi:Domain of unknown function (DUF1707)/Cell wall-active antibiotics response 4TMS YvqF
MSLRASDRDRDATVELLAQAASDGQLTLEEYSERVDVALAAKMQDELATVVSDLQQAHGQVVLASQTAAVSVPAPRVVPAVPPATDLTPAPEKIRAIMSSDQRQGRWTVPSHMQLRAVMGEITLELQEAVLTSHLTRIEASVTMGEIKVIVPEGVEVRLTGSAIMGEKKSNMTHAPVPGAPVIEIHARVLMGSLEVRPPRRPSQVQHAARQLRDAVQDDLRS